MLFNFNNILPVFEKASVNFKNDLIFSCFFQFIGNRKNENKSKYQWETKKKLIAQFKNAQPHRHRDHQKRCARNLSRSCFSA